MRGSSPENRRRGAACVPKKEAVAVQETSIDAPDVVAEVRAAFDAYEAALMANDVAALNAFFWRDARAVRFGPGDARFGHDAIAAFRDRRDTTDLSRALERVQITTFGVDCAVALATYRRIGSGRRGRQSQTWVRFAEGWRIVAAHVSLDPLA
jgi:ketosteroid isomerase-like protein